MYMGTLESKHRGKMKKERNKGGGEREGPDEGPPVTLWDLRGFDSRQLVKKWQAASVLLTQLDRTGC